MKTRHVLASLLVLLMWAGAANGGPLTDGPYTDTVPVTGTDWVGQTVSIQQFDPALGTLVGIEFTLAGHVEGSAGFENLDLLSPQTGTVNLTAEIELQNPDTSLIVLVAPLASESDPVLEYDGTTDYKGPSGKTYPDLNDDVSDTVTSPPVVTNFALFTGLGTIDLPVEATAKSYATSSGNYASTFSTSASAEVTVTYMYEIVPEPVTALLLGLPVMFLRRRR